MKRAVIIGILLGIIGCLFFSACAFVEESYLANEIYELEENMEEESIIDE